MIAVKVTGLTEDQVTRALEDLERLGAGYDVDVTTLYGPRWEIVGLELTGPRVAELTPAVMRAVTR